MKHLLLLKIFIFLLASCTTLSGEQAKTFNESQRISSSSAEIPTGMVVKSTSEPVIEMKQNKCPQGLDKAPRTKTNPQIAVGIEKKIGSKEAPSAYTQYDECVE